MRVKVVLERQRYKFLPSYGPEEVGTGDLHLTYRTAGNRRVAVLQLFATDRKWPDLFDPKLFDLSADRVRFVGAERQGSAWYVQEWICTLM